VPTGSDDNGCLIAFGCIAVGAATGAAIGGGGGAIVGGIIGLSIWGKIAD